MELSHGFGPRLERVKEFTVPDGSFIPSYGHSSLRPLQHEQQSLMVQLETYDTTAGLASHQIRTTSVVGDEECLRCERGYYNATDHRGGVNLLRKRMKFS